MGLDGFKPTNFQKRHPCDFRKSEDFFGRVGGRGEGVEERAVSNCVKQTGTCNIRCYYSIQLH